MVMWTGLSLKDRSENQAQTGSGRKWEDDLHKEREKEFLDVNPELPPTASQTTTERDHQPQTNSPSVLEDSFLGHSPPASQPKTQPQPRASLPKISVPPEDFSRMKKHQKLYQLRKITNYLPSSKFAGHSYDSDIWQDMDDFELDQAYAESFHAYKSLQRVADFLV